MPDLPSSVFVYGTLKQAEVRGNCWPRKPLSIVEATVYGELYDIGPYPALLPPAADGGERIAGEVWSFEAADIPPVLEVLDRIECFNQAGEADLYRRVVVEYHTSSGSGGEAFTYHYACRHTLVGQARRMVPNQLGVCKWP